MRSVVTECFLLCSECVCVCVCTDQFFSFPVLFLVRTVQRRMSVAAGRQKQSNGHHRLKMLGVQWGERERQGLPGGLHSLLQASRSSSLLVLLPIVTAAHAQTQGWAPYGLSLLWLPSGLWSSNPSSTFSCPPPSFPPHRVKPNTHNDFLLLGPYWFFSSNGSLTDKTQSSFLCYLSQILL